MSNKQKLEKSEAQELKSYDKALNLLIFNEEKMNKRFEEIEELGTYYDNKLVNNKINDMESILSQDDNNDKSDESSVKKPNETTDSQHNYVIIYPGSMFKKCWDGIIICMALYSILVLPLEYCFNFENYILDIIIYIVFACNILIRFRFAIITESGKLEVDKQKISKLYLKGDFVINLISTMPTQYLGRIYPKTTNLLLNCVFYIPKFLRVTRFRRLQEACSSLYNGYRNRHLAKFHQQIFGALRWGVFPESFDGLFCRSRSICAWRSLGIDPLPS